MSSQATLSLLSSGLAAFAWVHWRYSLWWYMSNRYGTGKIDGQPVRLWMTVNRFVGTATLTFFSVVCLVGAINAGRN